MFSISSNTCPLTLSFSLPDHHPSSITSLNHQSQIREMPKPISAANPEIPCMQYTENDFARLVNATPYMQYTDKDFAGLMNVTLLTQMEGYEKIEELVNSGMDAIAQIGAAVNSSGRNNTHSYFQQSFIRY